MKNIKSLLTSAGLFFALLFGLLFKREQSKREQAEKELEASKLANEADKATKQALEIKRDVKTNNIHNSGDRIERMRGKGYLRD